MSWTETGFDFNDYFVLAGVIIVWGIYFFIPKLFSKQFRVLIFIFSLTVASIMDNSFGVIPFDYYDIMDGPKYTGMDLVVYLLYPPYGYFFLYFYKKLCLSDKYIVFFISIATIFSICYNGYFIKLEFFIIKMGIKSYTPYVFIYFSKPFLLSIIAWLN